MRKSRKQTIEGLYGDAMRQIHAPSEANSRVLERVKVLREEQGRQGGAPSVRVESPFEQSASPDPGPIRARRPKARGVRPRALATVAIAGAVLAVPTLMLASGLGGMGAAEDDPFVLVAYASEGQQGGPILLSSDDKGLEPAGDSLFARSSFSMNLSCAGSGIERITYRIDGEDVSFGTLHDGGDYVVEHEFTVQAPEQNPADVHHTIDVDMQNPELVAMQLEMGDLSDKIDMATDPTEAARLQSELESVRSEEATRWNAQFDGLISDASSLNDARRAQTVAAASKIASATLTVAVTFEDGSTTTKRYKINPVANFADALASHLRASEDPEASSGDPSLTAPLFTIEEVS